MAPRPTEETVPTRRRLSMRNTRKDVHEAAQVPPSDFAAQQGEPQIKHDDTTHDRAHRHSVVPHQEQLSGILAV